MRYISLGGYSGCKVILVEEKEGRGGFVRKTSSSIDYNDRLRIQKNKQECFKSEFVKTPKVFNEGYDDEGLYYFDMEYIHGMALSEYIKVIEVGKIKGFIEIMIRCLNPSVREEEGPENNIFADKISKLKRELPYGESKRITKCIDALSNHKWNLFSKSNCHGDLTLENIIVRNDELYLIDFLDSFYDSWLIDVSTVLQDVQCLWSYRLDNVVNNNTRIRLMIFRDILFDYLKGIDERLIKEVQYGLLLKLLRIYPYANDEVTLAYLDHNLEQTYNRL